MICKCWLQWLMLDSEHFEKCSLFWTSVMTSTLLNIGLLIEDFIHATVAFLFASLFFQLAVSRPNIGVLSGHFTLLVNVILTLKFLCADLFHTDSFLQRWHQSWNSETPSWCIIITPLIFFWVIQRGRYMKDKMDGCKINFLTQNIRIWRTIVLAHVL